MKMSFQFTQRKLVKEKKLLERFPILSFGLVYGLMSEWKILQVMYKIDRKRRTTPEGKIEN